MLAYSLLMFAIGLLFIGLGLSIRRGNTKLIHDYHQKRVPEERRLEYARAFSVGMLTMAAGMILSGVLGLFGTEGPAMTASLLSLFAGLILGIVILGRVQKKYNGGFF